MKIGPMLLQEYEEKEVELRVFYFLGLIYCMAIFSQKDEKTKIDYRNYNKERPNRNVPFALPNDLKKKIALFFEKTGLQSGSLDFILNKEGKYIFLEVNPSGQFGWVSSNCNFYIEKNIAIALENYHSNHGSNKNL